MKISKVNKLIKAFQAQKPVKEFEPEWAAFHSSIGQGFSARAAFLAGRFKDASGRFLDDFLK